MAVLSATASSYGTPKESSNPLLKQYHTPHQAPPFSEIKHKDYLPAFLSAMDEVRSQVELIANREDSPTFENTIEALEYSGERLDAISNIFFNLNEAETSDEMQALALEIAPQLTALNNDITLNPKLFKRVEAVYQQTNETLSTEQKRLLEKTYKGFTRQGAALEGADQQEYRRISGELSELSLKFNQNLLAATNGFTLHLTDQNDLEGLPDFVVEGAAAEAKERNLKGWIITLQAPSMIPFMTYSPKRELKEKLWRAYNSRAFGGELDNTEIVKQITTLRLQLARLLGYNTYADYVLEERMAENAPTVNSFLDELLGRAVDAARKDVAEVTAYAERNGFSGTLMPWDFGYFSEKLKEEQFSITDEMTKPYFQLENVERGVFDLANRLYGLSFRANSEIPVYHPDVKAYEVFDSSGRFLSILYLDYFPRASKRGGAWMTEFRPQSIEKGVETRPLISLVCNFTKPTPTTPSLLTFNEVTTLLHEFGHALHGMLAEGHYPSLTGTSVYRDFVELPSQIMENWATEKEFLDLWAVHYQTGEKMPGELIERIVRAKNYLAAYGHIRQVSFGLTDMAWHSIEEPVTESVADFERRSMQRTQILPYIDGQCMATSFGHIFSGGYAAGYYSYKWAEVLEADAFSLFQERGIFNRDVADSFRREILSKGGTEHPMVLYVRFRGHKPDTSALFKKLGF